MTDVCNTRGMGIGRCARGFNFRTLTHCSDRSVPCVPFEVDVVVATTGAEAWLFSRSLTICIQSRTIPIRIDRMWRRLWAAISDRRKPVHNWMPTSTSDCPDQLHERFMVGAIESGLVSSGGNVELDACELWLYVDQPMRSLVMCMEVDCTHGKTLALCVR